MPWLTLVDVHHAHIAHAVVVRQSLKHCFAKFHTAPFVKQTLQLFSPFRIYEHTPIHMHACVLSQQSDLHNPVSCVLALFQHTLKLIMDHKKNDLCTSCCQDKHQREVACTRA